MKRKQGDFKGETYTTLKCFRKKWDFSPTDYVQNAIFSKTPLFLAPLIKKRGGMLIVACLVLDLEAVGWTPLPASTVDRREQQSLHHLQHLHHHHRHHHH